MPNNILEGGEKEVEKRVVLYEYTCERCGHVWLPRKRDRPRLCPHCGSPYWDRPRTRTPQVAQ